MNDCFQVSGALCGNGLCEAGDGENCVTCAADCAGKQKGNASRQFCCGFDDGQVNNPLGCGVDASDDRCIDRSNDWYCRLAPRVEACCGDTMCEGEETESSCAVDCAPPPATCSPSEPTEVSCFDGLDNDCDTAIDCTDGNCNGSVGATTNCGTGVCASTGNLECSGGTEVDTCTPGPAGVEGPFGNASCNDGLDNDCDGLTDDNDPDCQQAQDCSTITKKRDCDNTTGCAWDRGSRSCVSAP
jgi:hypothetical protein